MAKKDFPLTLLQDLKDIISPNHELYSIEKSPGYLLKLIDRDPDSDFSFTIEDVFHRDGKTLAMVNYIPGWRDSLSNTRTQSSMDNIPNHIKKWLSILEGYSQIKDFFNDPVIEDFTDEYYSEFEIIDEEADKPLSPDKIHELAGYLEYIEEHIDEYATEENGAEIAQIKKDIAELTPKLTTESRKVVAQGLSKLWARLTKLGKKTLNEFVIKFKDKLISKGVELLIEKGAEAMDFITSSGN